VPLEPAQVVHGPFTRDGGYEAMSAVLAAAGSVLTNKYAEGYPGHRYYGGCEWVDEVETLAIDRAKELFGAEHANVQPHAGGPANQAAYFGMLEHGDPVLGLRLDHGGHLTHGLKVNFSGRLYNVVQYGVSRETNLVEEEEVLALALEHRPKLILCGGSAYCRVVDTKMFRRVADEVGDRAVVQRVQAQRAVAAAGRGGDRPGRAAAGHVRDRRAGDAAARDEGEVARVDARD